MPYPEDHWRDQKKVRTGVGKVGEGGENAIKVERSDGRNDGSKAGGVESEPQVKDTGLHEVRWHVH